MEAELKINREEASVGRSSGASRPGKGSPWPLIPHLAPACLSWDGGKCGGAHRGLSAGVVLLPSGLQRRLPAWLLISFCDSWDRRITEPGAALAGRDTALTAEQG